MPVAALASLRYGCSCRRTQASSRVHCRRREAEVQGSFLLDGSGILQLTVYDARNRENKVEATVLGTGDATRVCCSKLNCSRRCHEVKAVPAAANCSTRRLPMCPTAAAERWAFVEDAVRQLVKEQREAREEEAEAARAALRRARKKHKKA